VTPTSSMVEQLIAVGMLEAEATAKASLYQQCRDVLGRAEHSAFFVPGRIEVLGKHTDYAGGRSLLCAVERGFIVLAAPRTDARLQVTDALRADPRMLALDPALEANRGDWSTYPATVARRIAGNFPKARRGADIVFASDLPPASGMSSSSALVIACFLGISAVNDLTKDPRYRSAITSPEDLAGYVAAVENGLSFGTLGSDRGVGTFGGSEDHTAILCCRAGFLSQYSFAPVRAERQIPFAGNRTFVVAHSGIAAEKTGSALAYYNEASLATQHILKAWNDSTGRVQPTLGAVIASAPSAANELRELLTEPRLIDRFNQFVLESTELIPLAADAFEQQNYVLLGEVVARSQQAAEDLLGNQIAETIALTRLARELGADAASAFGAGFGGAVWALVPAEGAELFTTLWREAYVRDFPVAAGKAEFFVTRPGPASLRLVGS
jgi:galactokinase